MDENKIIGIIAEQLDIPVEELSTETVFADLGADSLDLLEIVTEFEDEFGLEFEDDDIEKIKTVGDAVKYVKSLMEK